MTDDGQSVPVDLARRQKIAEALLKESENQIAAGSRILLALGILILWAWLSNLSPVDLSAGKVGSIQSRINDATESSNALVSSCVVAKDDRTPPRFDDLDKSKADCSSKFGRFTTSFDRLNSSIDLFLLKTSDVNIKFYPLLITIMISAMVIHMVRRRRAISVMVARAIAIIRNDLKLTGEQTGRLLPVFPLWLWPQSGKSALTHEDCEEYLEVRPAQRSRRWIYLAGVGLFAAVIVHVILSQYYLSSQRLGVSLADMKENWLSWPGLTTDQKGSIARRYVELGLTGSSLLDITLIIVILAPALRMFLSEEAGGWTGFRTNSGAGLNFTAASISRRAVLAGAAVVAVAGALAVPSIRSRALTGGFALLHVRPRYRLRRAVVRQSGGPETSGRPLVIRLTRRKPAGLPSRIRYHLVRPDSTVPGVHAPINMAKAERSTPEASLEALALETTSASWVAIVETHALALLSRQPDAAFAVLDEALTRVRNEAGTAFVWKADHPRASDLRLHDLLAGLLVRYGKLEELALLRNAIVDRLAITPRSESSIRKHLRSRAERWKAQGRWADSWRMDGKKWNRVRLPDLA